MTLNVTLGADLAQITEPLVARLAEEGAAAAITDQDDSIWGPEAQPEASIRLGWVKAAEISAPLVPEIAALREKFLSEGITHWVLGGMGGSSLAPEVITQTAHVDLTVLDSTVPSQVAAAFVDPEHTVVIVSSKSGSTVETDSHKRTAEQWFRNAGIDPTHRIVIVTDPGSPLDVSAREAGYTVFNADPNVGGRFSALTAFGLVPSGLAGADIGSLLDDAASVSDVLSRNDASNPAVLLAAALSARVPSVDKVALVPDGTPIVGLPDWAEQLIAESLGKNSTGVLPVVVSVDAPEVQAPLADVVIARLVESSAHLPGVDEIAVSGTLGEQFVLWEYAISLVGKVLGINPFDQPDVESAKVAARALLADRPEATPARLVENGLEARGSDEVFASAHTIAEALEELLGFLSAANGYVSVQAYLDRPGVPQLAGIRDQLAAITSRPVTFGWGPRFLHSTGQYHKGGPAEGVYLQITADTEEDRSIPGLPFTFGQLVSAQAAGDAQVLAAHGRPVLSLHLTGPVDAGAAALAEIVQSLG